MVLIIAMVVMLVFAVLHFFVVMMAVVLVGYGVALASRYKPPVYWHRYDKRYHKRQR